MRNGADCPNCGPADVVPVDDGEIIWMECATCGKTLHAWQREECPLIVRALAEKVDG